MVAVHRGGDKNTPSRREEVIALFKERKITSAEAITAMKEIERSERKKRRKTAGNGGRNK